MNTNLYKQIYILSAFFFSLLAFGQQKEISGKVTDSEGTPLPGASIVVKGTSNGVSADFDGFPWIFMGARRYFFLGIPWIFMDVHRFWRISTDFHRSLQGFSWIFMDLREFPWGCQWFPWVFMDLDAGARPCRGGRREFRLCPIYVCSWILSWITTDFFWWISTHIHGFAPILMGFP